MACGSPEQFDSGNLTNTSKDTGETSLQLLQDDLAKIRKDMESLIERKLEMFPDDHRQIVSAKVVMVGKDYRIEVASATMQ